MTPLFVSFPWFRRVTPRRVIAFGLVLGAIAAALVLLAGPLDSTTVTLDIGGHVRHIHTQAKTVGDLLDEEGVWLDSEDEVQPALETRLTGGLTITVRKAAAVALEVDGTVRRVRTQAVHPLDILAAQQIRPGPHDQVQVDGRDYLPDALKTTTWDRPPTSIRLVRGVCLTVIDAGSVQVLYTTQADVGQALDAAGFQLYLADRVTPDLSTAVADGLIVRITRSQPVSIVADGHRLDTRASGPTVGDALAAVGVAPIGLDYTVPALDTALVPGLTIRVVRVTEQVITEAEPIPFPVVYRPDRSLEPGAEQVIQAGAPGLREQVFRVRYEDGREVERTVQNERVIDAPIPRIIAYGLPPN